LAAVRVAGLRWTIVAPASGVERAEAFAASLLRALTKAPSVSGAPTRPSRVRRVRQPPFAGVVRASAVPG
jgi:hypothetical protein